MSRPPSPSSDLAARGRRFWRTITAEWECSAAELELLGEACRMLDELDELRAAVAEQGRSSPAAWGSRGLIRR